MALWEVEIIYEADGTYMNFVHETDCEFEDEVVQEIINNLSIVATEGVSL